MNRIKHTATAVPPGPAQFLRRISVYPRYYLQSARCRIAYLRWGKKYSQPVIFIAGLPKSGTTWMKRMLTSYPGYREILIPEAVVYEIEQGGSHDFQLPVNFQRRLRKKLAVTKMHIPGTGANAECLHRSSIKYLILFRDLRDVAVSYTYYVRRTPWHPEHRKYRALDLDQGLKEFGRTLLVPYADWVRSWEKNRDPALSLMLRYEDLLEDTAGTLQEAARHFQLPAGREPLQAIAAEHSFKKMSGGRERGESEPGSFFRKGVSGGWKEHFTPELRQLYREKTGDYFERFGYGDWEKG